MQITNETNDNNIDNSHADILGVDRMAIEFNSELGV